MWFIILLFFGLIIYMIVSLVVDSISDKANAIKREKYYGEKEISFFTTYENDNISNEDIMLLFISQIKKYRQRHFIIEYNVFNDKEKQEHAWSINTTKQIYGWGIIYNIQFRFSNGWVSLSFSNREFFQREKVSLEYYLAGIDFGAKFIEATLNMCRDEAKIIWKANGKEPVGNLPFNYIFLSGSNKSSSHEDTTQFDLVSFYRNLLGLKLRFSHDELKKSYREAVGKYHPDRYGASSSRDRENAEMLMKQVNDAYEKLKEIAG